MHPTLSALPSYARLHSSSSGRLTRSLWPCSAGGSMSKAKMLPLVELQAHVGAVEKDARNDFHRYAYASAEQLIGEAKPALGKAGVVVLPIKAELSGSQQSPVCRRAFRIINGAESYEVAFDWPVVCEKGRPLDKAWASALTSSLAYFLRDLLLMPRVEAGTDLNDNTRDAPSAPVPEQRRGYGKSSAVPTVTPPPGNGAQSARSGVLEERCPGCGGDVWDNSSRRAGGWKGPAYKCCKNGDACFIQWESTPPPPEMGAARRIVEDEERSSPPPPDDDVFNADPEIPF